MSDGLKRRTLGRTGLRVSVMGLGGGGNVFEVREGDIPVIARPDDCQTCFMCELYCPADALYVSPFADRHVDADEQALAGSDTLGAYARNMGWKGAKPHGADEDPTFRFRALMQRAE